MRNLAMWARLIGISVFTVLLLNFFPSQIFGDQYFQGSIAAYAFFGLIIYALIYVTGSASLQYFRMPRWHLKTLFAFVWVVPTVWVNVTDSNNVSKPLIYVISGIIFLFVIGFGEELLSRGLIFGVLSRFGLYKAVFGSSLLFGLMHLNLYIGSDWDPWQAYSHVVNATSFGVLACGLMIISRSIWPAIILHLFGNWSLVFSKYAENTLTLPDWRFGSFWEGLTYPLPNALNAIGAGILFLILDRMGLPQYLYRLAVKWKLIKPVIKEWNA